MKIIRRFRTSLKNMSPPAYTLLRYSVMISCVFFAVSALVLAYAGGFSAYTYRLYCLSRDLYNTPFVILLAAIIGAAVIEERAGQ